MKDKIIYILLIFIINMEANNVFELKILGKIQEEKKYNTYSILNDISREETQNEYVKGTKHLVKGLLKLEQKYYLNKEEPINQLENEDITILKTKKTKRIKLLSKENFRAYYIKKYNVYAIKYKNNNMDFFTKKQLIKYAKEKTIKFLKPIKEDYYISSGFGTRVHPITKKRTKHRGVDFVAYRGTNVYALSEGKITKIGKNHRIKGNFIEITHNNAFKSYYLHLDSINKKLKKGLKIKAGQLVGKLGNTGRSTGAHLHLGLKKDQKWVNPLNYIKGYNGIQNVNKRFANNWKLKRNIKRNLRKINKKLNS